MELQSLRDSIKKSEKKLKKQNKNGLKTNVHLLRITYRLYRYIAIAKNNSKEAYQIVKELTCEKKGECIYMVLMVNV